MSEFKLNLLNNAFDFLEEALDRFDENDLREIKYSILHLATAVELILKARLVKEHWSLIFKDPAKATLEKFEDGDFPSAYLPEVKERLTNICKINLGHHKPTLEKLGKLRNKIQHFAFSLEIETSKSTLIKAWSFIWDFMHDQLYDDIEKEGIDLEHFKSSMFEHEKFVSQRLEILKVKIENLGREGFVIVQCPECLQETFKLSEENPSCLFCRYEDEPDKVADYWATVFIGHPHTDPKDRQIDPVLKKCSWCFADTKVEFENGGMVPPDPAWICFSCGQSGPPTVPCRKCGKEFTPEDWESEHFICPECE